MSGSNGLPKYPSTNRENEFMDLKHRGVTYTQTDQITILTGTITPAQWVAPGSINFNGTTPNTIAGPAAANLMAELEKKYLATPGSTMTVTLHNSDPTNTKTVTVAGLTPSIIIPPGGYVRVGLVVTQNDNGARTFAYYAPTSAGTASVLPTAPTTIAGPEFNDPTPNQPLQFSNGQPRFDTAYNPAYPIMVWNGANWVGSTAPGAQAQLQWINSLKVNNALRIGNMDAPTTYQRIIGDVAGGTPLGLVTAGTNNYPLFRVRFKGDTLVAGDGVQNASLCNYQALANLVGNGQTIANQASWLARAFSVAVLTTPTQTEVAYIGFDGTMRSPAAAHYATAFNMISRRDTKREITDVKNSSLAALQTLNLQEFNYKTDQDKEPRRIGLIAEDVADAAVKNSLHLLEGLVSRTPEGALESINTSQLLYLAVHAIQELSAELKSLKGKKL